MQWFITMNGETVGPHEGPALYAKIQEMAASGQSLATAHVRDDAGSVWMPIQQSPFASALAAPVAVAAAYPAPLATPAKAKPPWWQNGRVGIGLGLLVAIWIGKCGIDSSSKAKGTAQSELIASQVNAETKRIAAAPPPPRELTFTERVASETTLAGALKLLRPTMTDTQNELPPAAATLALWGSRHLTWADLQSIPETKRALVMKDPDAERAKRLCVTGTINEIEVDRSGGAPVYLGGMMTPGMDFVRFMAVGSTGTLVEGNGARLCGIVTGKYSYTNAGGGTTHSMMVVGMFDLPDNKRTPAAAL